MFILSFEHISHFVLVSLLLTLTIQLLAGFTLMHSLTASQENTETKVVLHAKILSEEVNDTYH